MLMLTGDEVEGMRSFWYCEGRAFLEACGDEDALARLNAATTTSMPDLDDFDLSDRTLRLMRYVVRNRKWHEDYARKQGRDEALREARESLVYSVREELVEIIAADTAGAPGPKADAILSRFDVHRRSV